MALFRSYTNEYLTYHHRNFIWPWNGIETETNTGTLDFVPKVPMSNRRRENMSKKVRHMKRASMHWEGRNGLMGTHQGLLDWEWWSIWSNCTIWIWLAMMADWESKNNGTGFWLDCMDRLCMSLVCLDAHLNGKGWRGKHVLNIFEKWQRNAYFSDKYYIPKSNQDQINNLNRLNSHKEIVVVIKHLRTTKTNDQMVKYRILQRIANMWTPQCAAHKKIEVSLTNFYMKLRFCLDQNHIKTQARKGITEQSHSWTSMQKF